MGLDRTKSNFIKSLLAYPKKSIKKIKFVFLISQVLVHLRIITVNSFQINLENIKRGTNVIAYNFTATRNTWLHQRRKRRAQRRLSKLSNSSDDAIVATEPTPPPSGETSLENTSMEVDGLPQATETSDCICGLRTDLENALNKLAEVDVNSSPGSAKRELEDDDADDFYQSKKFRSDTGECKCHLNEFFVKGLLVVRRDEESHVWVELSWLEGSENREVLHQILQYVKNNFKFN